jgi:hypothetical protein
MRDDLPAMTVAAVAYQAGFRGRGWQNAVAVSFAENGTHNATAQNLNTDRSVDTGLWQINSVHGIPIRQLFDPQRNANAAFSISSGGKDFSPWTTYPVKSNLLLPVAMATINNLNRHGGAVTWLQNNPLGTTPGVKGGVDSPNLGSQIASVTPIGEVANFLGKLVNPHTWFRIFEVLIGGLLLLFGVYRLSSAAGFKPPTVVPV